MALNRHRYGLTEIRVSPLPVCFLSCAGLIPMLVSDGVRDDPVGKFPVAALSLCEEGDQQ